MDERGERAAFPVPGGDTQDLSTATLSSGRGRRRRGSPAHRTSSAAASGTALRGRAGPRRDFTSRPFWVDSRRCVALNAPHSMSSRMVATRPATMNTSRRVASMRSMMRTRVVDLVGRRRPFDARTAGRSPGSRTARPTSNTFSSASVGRRGAGSSCRPRARCAGPVEVEGLAAQSGRSENSTVPVGDPRVLPRDAAGLDQAGEAVHLAAGESAVSPIVASARSGSTLARTVVSALRAASSVAASVTRLAASSAVMRAAPMTSTEATDHRAEPGHEPLVRESSVRLRMAAARRRLRFSRRWSLGAGVGLGRNPQGTVRWWLWRGPRRWYCALEAGGRLNRVRDGRGPGQRWTHGPQLVGRELCDRRRPARGSGRVWRPPG